MAQDSDFRAGALGGMCRSFGGQQAKWHHWRAQLQKRWVMERVQGVTAALSISIDSLNMRKLQFLRQTSEHYTRPDLDLTAQYKHSYH